MHEKAESRTKLTYFVLVNLHSVELQNPKVSLELKIVDTRKKQIVLTGCICGLFVSSEDQTPLDS